MPRAYQAQTSCAWAGTDAPDKAPLTSFSRMPPPRRLRAAHPQGAGGRGGGPKGGRAAATAASERDRLYQAGSVALMSALPQLLGGLQAEPEVVRGMGAGAGRVTNTGLIGCGHRLYFSVGGMDPPFTVEHPPPRAATEHPCFLTSTILCRQPAALNYGRDCLLTILLMPPIFHFRASPPPPPAPCPPPPLPP